MNILIPNAASPKNIGDLAILTGLLLMLPQNCKIKIHSHDPYSLSKELNQKQTSQTLYSWAVFEKKDIINRISRIMLLVLGIFFKIRFAHQRVLSKILDDYQNADIILFTGGGYLRSQNGITQSLNLIMLLLMLYYASTYKAKKIIAPISFGPFAHKWQERLSGRVIKNFDIIMAREKYSYKILKKYTSQNLLLSADTSFLLKYPRKKPSSKKLILGFTIRKWFDRANQEEFEENFAKALIQFSKKSNCVIQPIVQVDAPEYGDVDLVITKNIMKILHQNEIKTNPIVLVNKLSTIKIYKKVDLLLGVRMHSNILAALQGTPFIAVSYEHKTIGISKSLDIGNYCIDIKKVNSNALYKKLILLEKEREEISKKLYFSLGKIRTRENKTWKKIFLTGSTSV